MDKHRSLHSMIYHPSLLAIERWLWDLLVVSRIELCTTQTVPSPIHVRTREVANWDSLVVQAQSFAQHRLSCPPSLWGLERWVKLGLTSCSSTELGTTQTVLSPFPVGTREVAWDSLVVQAQSLAQHRLSCPPSLWGLERWLGTHSLFKHRAWHNTDCPVPLPCGD